MSNYIAKFEVEKNLINEAGLWLEHASNPLLSIPERVECLAQAAKFLDDALLVFGKKFAKTKS